MQLFSFVRFHARMGQESSLEEVLREVLPLSRQEAGCVSIHAFRATRDRQLFYIHSVWVNEEAFDLHAKLAHTVKFLERAQPLLDHPLEATRTERIA